MTKTVLGDYTISLSLRGAGFRAYASEQAPQSLLLLSLRVAVDDEAISLLRLGIATPRQVGARNDTYGVGSNRLRNPGSCCLCEERDSALTLRKRLHNLLWGRGEIADCLGLFLMVTEKTP